MRVKQEYLQRSLYLSNGQIDSDRVGLTKRLHDVSPRPVHKHRILCVDDDVLGTNMRAEILEEGGYSVVVFHSPLEATRCDLSTLSLAILDFEMSGPNGRELLLRIRAMGARFPIVLLTGCLAGLRVKIAFWFRGVSTRACPFITYSTRSRNFWIQTRAPIMARDRDTFRRTDLRSRSKPAARVAGPVREKRQFLPISDARNSIGMSKAMQLVAVNVA
jgi:response regulator receiver domain-containing protein